MIGAHAYGGHKKGPDRGIDGIVYFKTGRRSSGFAVVQVKGGETVGREMIASLRGTMERERADMAIFICLAKPTSGMIKEALDAGTFDIGGTAYNRIQILTVDDWFGRRRPHLPPMYRDVPAPKEDSRPRRAGPTPDQLRREPQIALPIRGGRDSRRQTQLPLDEPLLVPPQRSPRGRRRTG